MQQFLPFALFALPALSSPLLTTRAAQEWSISSMDVHFMGDNTGLPGNQWPDSQKFPSTLNFTLDLPSSSVKCSANWPYKAVSTNTWDCGSGVSFALSALPSGEIREASWTLTVTKKGDDGTFVASQAVENNSVGSSTSFLSCMGGPPLDGIRCKLGGWAGKSSIPLSANSQ